MNWEKKRDQERLWEKERLRDWESGLATKKKKRESERDDVRLWERETERVVLPLKKFKNYKA